LTISDSTAFSRQQSEGIAEMQKHPSPPLGFKIAVIALFLAASIAMILDWDLGRPASISTSLEASVATW
jgi:hypothetical protein